MTQSFLTQSEIENLKTDVQNLHNQAKALVFQNEQTINDDQASILGKVQELMELAALELQELNPSDPSSFDSIHDKFQPGE